MQDGILLSDWITEEEFNYSPTGELSAAIALAQDRRDWFCKGEQAAEQRIIKLLDEFIDNCDLPEVEDRLEWFKDALIKGEK